MTWKASALKNAYEDGRYQNFNGNGCEGFWKEERPSLTYEDYWIFWALVGHPYWSMYIEADIKDGEIFSMVEMKNLGG